MPPVQINQVEPPVQINQVDHERLMTATQATATEVVVVAYWFELHFLSVTHNIIIVQGRDTLGQNLKQNLKKTKLSKIKSQADRLRLAAIKSPPDSLNTLIIHYIDHLSRGTSTFYQIILKVFQIVVSRYYQRTYGFAARPRRS